MLQRWGEEDALQSRLRTYLCAEEEPVTGITVNLHYKLQVTLHCGKMTRKRQDSVPRLRIL